MPIISGGGSGGLPGVTVSGTAAASKALIATSSSAASWSFPPGFEVGYDEITAGVNIAGTTAGAPTTIITCAAHTFDGSPVLMSFHSPSVTFGSPNGNFVSVALWESGAQLGLIYQGAQPTAAGGGIWGIDAQYRFTPSAGSHSYLIRAFVAATTGSPNVGAGTGGTTSASFFSAFARFVKV